MPIDEIHMDMQKRRFADDSASKCVVFWIDGC